MRVLAASILGLSCLGLLGCNQKQNPEELKEKTAQATAEAKRDARAIAAGIKEGWSRDKPLDINTASKGELMSLPGMTIPWTIALMEGRPYNQPSDLLTKKILPKTEYDKISDRITVKK